MTEAIEDLAISRQVLDFQYPSSGTQYKNLIGKIEL